MSPSSEVSWLSEKRRLARFHLECEQPGFGGVRRRQAAAEEQSLNTTPPLHSSTPLAGAAASKDWRKNFASSPPASDCSNNGDWSLGGDSGYGGLGSSRIGGRLPFPEKSSSWWSLLLRRVLGRPSFLEPEMASRWVRLHPQQMIALVLTAALLSCVGFSSVLLFRHMPIRRNPNPARVVIEQEQKEYQKMLGEVYDDPFEGMEQVFGKEEYMFDLDERKEEDEKLEEVEDNVEQMVKDDLEKKKKEELLSKIKSFGLPTAPVDNLLGPAKAAKEAKKIEDKANLESLKNTASSPDSKGEVNLEDDGGQAVANNFNVTIGLGEAANASGRDVKQKLKKTKVVNPLIKKRRKKTSKAKKTQEL